MYVLIAYKMCELECLGAGAGVAHPDVPRTNKAFEHVIKFQLAGTQALVHTSITVGTLDTQVDFLF